MLIYLVAAILVSLFLILSLKYCLRAFDKLELVGLFIGCTCISQQFFFLVSSSYKHAVMVEEWLPFFIIRLNYGVIAPSLLVWALYFITVTSSRWLRILAALLWAAVVILFEWYGIFIGVLVDNNWTLYHELIKRFVIVAIAYLLMLIWQNVLRRDGIIP